MAIFGPNILPVFSYSDWTCSSGATISNNVLTAPKYGLAVYSLDLTTVDSEGNTVYYNIGDLAKLSCTYLNTTRGRFIIQVYYTDVETSVSYNNTINC